ncbi:MAG: hypothetical protein ACYTG2_08680 [Planctomycetota bacterium]|jgi:hypothetical protein
MKREIPILLTVLCGLAITWSFFSPWKGSQAVNSELLAWALVFFSVAFLLGIANLVRISLKQIANGHPDAIYKVVLLVVLVGYLGIGILEIHQARFGLFGSTEGNIVGIGGAGERALRDWFYNKMFIPLQATMFSLLAFYIASAAFRAFRARSLESTLLLTAGTVVMLGQVPLGDQLTGGLASRALAFLMVYVNGAGQTAIIVGATLGVLATGLRIVLGIERSYLSE